MDLAKEFIPAPFDGFMVIAHNAGEFGQFMAGHAIAICQLDFGFDPELGNGFALADVNVQRLAQAASLE